MCALAVIFHTCLRLQDLSTTLRLGVLGIPSFVSHLWTSTESMVHTHLAYLSHGWTPSIDLLLSHDLCLGLNCDLSSHLDLTDIQNWHNSTCIFMYPIFFFFTLTALWLLINKNKDGKPNTQWSPAHTYARTCTHTHDLCHGLDCDLCHHLYFDLNKHRTNKRVSLF